MSAHADNPLPNNPPRWPARLWLGGLVVLALTLPGSLRFLSTASFRIGEEHFRLGQHLRNTGVLSINDQPSLYRPPGFPIFVAGVLWTRDHLGLSMPDERAVVLAHGVLMSLGSLAVYGYFVRRRSVVEAVALGCLFSFHPVVLIIATSISYPLLHLVLVLVATIALATALRARPRPAGWTLVAGLLWGAATLARPLSLILPPFIVLLALWELGWKSWRPALRFSAVFVLGMALIIGPYAWRNYLLSGRLVAVNAQAGFSFWGVSVEKTAPDADFPAWRPIWREHGMPIFTRLTGATSYNLDAHYGHVLDLNDAFAQEARRNIAANPGIYLHNVLKTFRVFNTETSAWWIYRFRVEPRNEDPVRPPRTSPAEVFTVIVSFLALAGLIRGLRRGDPLARTLLVIYAMFCIATCIGFPTARYIYPRLALMVLAIPLVCPEGARLPWRRPSPPGEEAASPFYLRLSVAFAVVFAALGAVTALVAV